MRLPRVRFTVRRLMIAVLAVAALLGAFEAGPRWERANNPLTSLKIYSRRQVGLWKLATPESERIGPSAVAAEPKVPK